MAVVTGRPLEDCLYFLRAHDLECVFTDAQGKGPVCVTMHDAPSKPSPEPVRLALARRVWRHG